MKNDRRKPSHNTGNHGALLMENLAAPLFLPRLGIVRSAAGNESSLSGVAHAFCGGKNNGVVARNVMRQQSSNCERCDV
jgi:hypothetical protein